MSEHLIFDAMDDDEYTQFHQRYPQAVRHKWLGDDLSPGSSHIAEELILCWKAGGVRPSGLMYDVTRENSSVTCGDCLEYIHA